MEHSPLGTILAIILLRLWLGMRAIQSGVEKFAGTGYTDQAVNIDGVSNSYGLTEAVASKTYALSNYNGVPAALSEKFSKEPFIPTWFLSIYDSVLGPLLIIVGLCILLGLALRTSLFVMGLIYTSLTFGLILIKQDAGVAWLGTHLLLVVLALQLANHNRFSITKKY
jgi:thiosulfate dehydrogenase [quinone] large subunit